MVPMGFKGHRKPTTYYIHAILHIVSKIHMDSVNATRQREQWLQVSLYIFIQ